MSKLKEFLKPRSIFGFMIIAIALLIIFENLGISIFDKVLGNWPLALLIIGGAMIYGPERGRTRALPYILMGFGTLFLLAKYDVFNIHWGSFIVPILLLLLGVYLLKPRLLKQEDQGDEVGQKNTIEVFSVLGGGEFSTRSSALTDGNIVCVLAGANVDIRDADMDGDFMELDIFCLMGGVEIKVPLNWQVSIKVVPFLGGVTDQTTCAAEKLQLPKKSLLVKGFAVMGGIEVKN